jgi:hypothetical protein
MKVLIACEFSGIVREEFLKLDHNAHSCDLLPTELSSHNHYLCSIEAVLSTTKNWDLLIAFPPCTHLAASGARWWINKQKEQKEAIEFVKMLGCANIPRIAIENPIGILSTVWRKPDQIIQPWQFGHGETKATCLWLKNLPLLQPTNIVEGREARVHRTPPSPERWKVRSRTLPGIAEAMASQWGNL